MKRVVHSPRLVGSLPFGTWDFGGAIDVVPVRGIVTFEFSQAPGNLHLAKHREVGGGVGSVRVEECAVPVKEYAARLWLRDKLHVTIVILQGRLPPSSGEW